MLVNFVGENINGSTFSCTQHLYELSQDCSYDLGCVQSPELLEQTKTKASQKEHAGPLFCSYDSFLHSFFPALIGKNYSYF